MNLQCRHPEGRKAGSMWCDDCNLTTCVNFHSSLACGLCEYIGKCENDPQKADYCPISVIKEFHKLQISEEL